MANGTNTPSVMTSCMIFSCERFSAVLPMRFAGTWRMYSNSAIPQLTRIAMTSGRARMLPRCAYHAKVINTFEQIKSPADVTTVEFTSTLRALSPQPLALSPLQCPRLSAVDVEQRAMAVRRYRRREKRDGVRDFGRLAEPLDARCFGHLRLGLRQRDLVLVGERLQTRLEPFGLDESRIDRVDADAVLHAAVRERFREQPE